MNFSVANILAARRIIKGVADNTPMVPSYFMQGKTGQEFLLKLENMQPIGAFKLRGAYNAIMNLPDNAPGVTCCSTGNHGRGVAFAAYKRGLRAVICMSNLVPQVKVDAIKALGAEVRIIGESQDEAEVESRRLVQEDGLIEIPPFDDPFVIAGQGTIGLEMLEARPDIATILVPLSGGGLAAGIAVAAKSINPDIKVIGVTMDRGAAMHLSIAAGKPVEVEEFSSLADSLGGGIGMNNRLSFPLCQKYLDETVLVTEEEIYHALQALYYEDRIIAEGSCVVGIAAVLAGKLTELSGPVTTVITGRNVDMQMFTKIANGEPITLDSYKINGTSYRRQ